MESTSRQASIGSLGATKPEGGTVRAWWWFTSFALALFGTALDAHAQQGTGSRGARLDGIGGVAVHAHGLSGVHGNAAAPALASSKWMLRGGLSSPNVEFVVEDEWGVGAGIRTERICVYADGVRATAPGSIRGAGVDLAEETIVGGAAGALGKPGAAMLAWGLGVKHIRRVRTITRSDDLPEERDTASGVSGDIGVLAHLVLDPESAIRFSTSIENVRELDLGTRGTVDRRIAAGIGYWRVLEGGAAISLGGQVANWNGYVGREMGVGSELEVRHVAIRVGYLDGEHSSGLTVGAGVNIVPSAMTLRADWAYAPSVYEHDRYHRLEVGIEF